MDKKPMILPMLALLAGCAGTPPAPVVKTASCPPLPALECGSHAPYEARVPYADLIRRYLANDEWADCMARQAEIREKVWQACTD